MRRFLPFQPLLPRTVSREDHLVDLFTPPFDELGLTVRQELHRRHRHNFVRFESCRELPGEPADATYFDRTHAAFVETYDAGYIRRDETASYFLMEITGGPAAVTGIVGMFQVESDPPPASFEATYPIDVEDRVRQLDSFSAQTAPVTMGYPVGNEPVGALDSIMTRTKRRKPMLQFTSPDQKHVRIWRMTEKAHDIEPLVARRNFVILDGQDRWNAALQHARRLRAEDKTPSPFRAYNFVMAWIVPVDPSLELFRARHRVLRKGTANITGEEILEKLEEYFEIERYKLTRPGAKEAELVNLLDEMDMIGRLQHAYGLYVGDKAYYLLLLRDADAYERMLETQHTRRWKRLDVTVLHSLIFQNVLGIGWQSASDLSKFSMPTVASRSIALVDDGFAEAVFLLNPPSLQSILEIAQSQEDLPPRTAALACRPLVGPIMASVRPKDYVGDKDST